MLVPQLRATDVPRGSDRAPVAGPDPVALSVSSHTPDVALRGQPLGRLSGESRFGLQLGDARPRCDQPTLVSGDVALEVGQPARPVRGAAERAEPAHLVIAPAPGLGQRVSRLL